MRDPKPWLRCNVVYYEPLDVQTPTFGDEFSALAYLRRLGGSIPPMLAGPATNLSDCTPTILRLLDIPL